jgi:demethylmenaquinone methyltransferase/2-methoxy-6-polyprenyl-1,4-benzoquinol methylase
VLADLFEWQPTRSYDVVFFSFWISHVPRSRFSEFWALVRTCTGPDGRVFVIDNRNDPFMDAEDGGGGKDPYVVQYGQDLHLRRLNDGSEYRVVKVMYEPDELQGLIEAEGWKASIEGNRRFVWGTAHG